MTRTMTTTEGYDEDYDDDPRGKRFVLTGGFNDCCSDRVDHAPQLVEPAGPGVQGRQLDPRGRHRHGGRQDGRTYVRDGTERHQRPELLPDSHPVLPGRGGSYWLVPDGWVMCNGKENGWLVCNGRGNGWVDGWVSGSVKSSDPMSDRCCKWL